jgi:hypothetical protein
MKGKLRMRGARGSFSAKDFSAQRARVIKHKQFERD